MRYIPSLRGEAFVQVPQEKNSFINVQAIGASGKGDIEFTGKILDISDEVITFSDISDGRGSSLSQYREVLKPGTGLQFFSYRAPGPVDSPILTVASTNLSNVEFPTSSGSNPNLAPLTYFIWGFNPVTGVLPNSRSVVNVGNSILNPTFWSIEQNVQINFSRQSAFTLPIIYRLWGTTLDFLGVVGNNKIGYSSSNSSFRDLGQSEIPYWSEDPSLPPFLSDLFSTSGFEVFQTKKVTGKGRVTILPEFGNSPVSFVRCEGTDNSSELLVNDTVKFYIDDTRYVRQAIDLAQSGAIKEVFFPAGQYNILDSAFVNTSQVDYSNISLRGISSSSKLKRLPCTLSNSQNPGFINFTGRSSSNRIKGIGIRSLQIDGNNSGSFSLIPESTSESSVSLSFADGISIEDCLVVNNAGAGIQVINSNSLFVKNNRVNRTGRSYEQSASPLLIDTCENLVAQGNVLELATTGPKIISTEFSTINGNIVRGCGDRGFELQTSSAWNAQGNLAYSDNDSIIRSVDTYNNEYSKATIEIRKGFAMDPIYLTVTYGGEAVSIVRGSVEAAIYTLNPQGLKQNISGYFRVIETIDQSDAGIFSITLPGTISQTVAGKSIPSTSSLNNPSGYMYEVKGSVRIGKFKPLSIRNQTIGPTNYTAIRLRNSSDLLSFQIYSSSQTSENDRVVISGFNNTLPGWDTSASYVVVDVEPDTNSLLLASNPALSGLPGEVNFDGGVLSILRSNYFIADGNIIVHTGENLQPN